MPWRNCFSPNARPVRVIAFNKTEGNNWTLPWHQDRVVALRERGIPHAYLLFEGEGHGFRKGENIVRALGAELSFYAQVLGFEPGGDVPKLEIEHLSTGVG